MASKISINLDTSKENYTLVKCKENDDLTLEAMIYENGLALDLTNKSISIQALKADGTYIIQSTGITKENNKMLADLIRDFSRVPGTTKIEVVLIESGKQNTTFSFYLEVVASVIKGAVTSEDKITSLEEVQAAVTEIDRINEETRILLNNAGAASKEDVNKINSQLEHIENEKLDKTGIVTMANMGQDVKEAMTGGSVAVVGKNTILNENIVDKQITYNKTKFIELDEEINLFDGEFINARLTGGDNDYSFTPASGDITKQMVILKVSSNTTYSIVKSSSDIFKIATDSKELDLNSSYKTDGIMKELSSATTYTLTTGKNDKYLYIYVSTTGQSPFVQVTKGTATTFISSEYTLFTKGNKNITKNFKNLIRKNLLSTSLVTYNYDKQVNFSFVNNRLTSDGQILIVNTVNDNIKSYLLPLIDLTLKDYDVVYLDVDELKTLSDRNIPSSMIKKATHYSIDGYNKYFDNTKYIPLFWYAYDRLSNSLGVKINTSTTNNVNRKIKVIKTTDSLCINVPSDKNSKYVQYNYRKQNSTSINFNQYRVFETKIVDENLSTLLVIGENSEWEGAILETGKADYMGGFHGDEINQEISVLIDGVPYDISDSNEFTKECTEIKVVNKSILNRCDTPNDNVFTRYKISTWNLKEYTIENKYIALQNIEIKETKTVMMSFDKTYNGNEIISRGRYDYDYQVTDLTKAFAGIGCGISRTDVSQMELWGLNSGIYASIKCEYDRDKYPNRNQLVQDFSEYNRVKCYFDVTGQYSMKQGEILRTKSIINIKC